MIQQSIMKVNKTGFQGCTANKFQANHPWLVCGVKQTCMQEARPCCIRKRAPYAETDREEAPIVLTQMNRDVMCCKVLHNCDGSS